MVGGNKKRIESNFYFFSKTAKNWVGGSVKQLIKNKWPRDEINMTRFILCCSRNVTQNHGDSRTSISMSVPFVEFHGISFSY